MTKQKPNNPNSDRDSRVASYLMSVAIHLLLLLIFFLLINYRGGGSLEGGATMDFGAIDVMVMQAEAAETPTQPVTKPNTAKPQPIKPVPTVPEPPKPIQTVVNTPPQDVRPDDIVIPAKEDKPEKPVVQPQIPVQPQPNPNETVETKPEQTPVSKSQPKQSQASDVRTTGEGGDKPKNTVGTGQTDHEGTGTSTGPLPTGSFGGMSRVPDCKKNDADNDQLQFAFEVSYRPGQGQPIISLTQVTASFDPSTIQMTKRILLDSFDPNSIPPDQNVTYEGYVVCRCGSNPGCDLRQK